MQNFKPHQESLINGSIITNRKLIQKKGVMYSVIYGHMLGLQILFDKPNKLDSEGYFYQSFRQLEKQLKMGEKTLRKYLKQLEKDGLIQIKKVKSMQACYYKITDNIFTVLKDDNNSEHPTEENTNDIEIVTAPTAINTDAIGIITGPTVINTVEDRINYCDHTEIFSLDSQQNLLPNNNSFNNTILDDSLKDTNINNSLSAFPQYLSKIIDDNREDLEKNKINLKQLVNTLKKSNNPLSLIQYKALINHLINYAEPIRKTAVFVSTALNDIENIEAKYRDVYIEKDISASSKEPSPPADLEKIFYNWLDERE